MKAFSRSILFISLFFLFGAPSIYFDVKVPAAVDLPSNVKTVAIIDRSLSENEVVNLVEKGLLSTLSKRGDRFSRNCVDGIFEQINSQSGVRAIRTDIVEKRKGTALDLPKPMEWFEVEAICKQYETDAVIAVEIFSRQYIDNVAEVKVGVRIYEPKGRLILDEFQYYHGIGKPNKVPEGEPGSLIVNTLNDDDALKKASYIAGTIYAKRITPYWIRVKRDYYKRSKRDPKMAEGARMMEVNDWDAAREAFQLAIEHGHLKTKGRASHNLAIVHEINGELELAFQTAQDGWGKYGNKRARDYAGLLQRRMNEVRILRAQEQN